MINHNIKNYYPNLLIIYGNGRNIGKTTLTSALIKKISINKEIIAIKISPHFHNTVDVNYIVNHNNIKIIEEKDTLSGKDSSRMLAAGAVKVYYVQCTDESINKVEELLLSKIPKKTAIICESSGLLKITKPGASIFIQSANNNSHKKPKPESLIVQSMNGIPDIDIGTIYFENSKWVINKVHFS